MFSLKPENSFVTSVSSVITYATQTQPHTKVIVIALENSNVKFDRLNRALKEAIKAGSWIIIENAHHVTEWPRDILNLFYRIKDSFKFHQEQEISKDYRLNIQQNKNNPIPIESTELPMQFIKKQFPLASTCILIAS